MRNKHLQYTGGIVTIIIIVYLMYLTVLKRKGEGLLLAKGVQIAFPNVEGLKFGNIVFIKGLAKGEVNQIKIVEDKVLVDIIFEEEVQFYRDYSIVLKNFSVFGKKAIYINPGREKYGPIVPGVALKGETIENPFDYAAMVFKENKENLRLMLENIAAITKKIDLSASTLSLLLNNPKFYHRVTKTFKNARALLDKLEEEYQKYRTEAATDAIMDAIYQFDK
jgi:ABC-type transporter Mla subunit MlaD